MKQSFVWARAGAIARKESYHIRRDPFTLALALVFPVFTVVIYGVAIDFNVKNIPLAVSDSDKSQTSRRLIDTFGSSNYFQVQGVVSPHDALDEVNGERARAALIIPPRFEKDLLAGRSAEAQLVLDGADNSTIGSVSGYIGAIQTLSEQRIAGANVTPPYELRSRYLFNPELNSRWFVIPGLTVVVMSILSILLTALTVAREWENGSMELLLSTPAQPLEIIIGKLLPYGVLGVVAVTFVYVIARVIFGVPFVGSHVVFGLGCVLFLVTYLAQGLFISITTRKQVIAMQFAMLSGLLPSNMLSGFVFPIDSMPPFFQYFTMLLPARWFMRIARDTFLKGSSLTELAGSFFALSALGCFMIFNSVRKFKRDLEP